MTPIQFANRRTGKSQIISGYDYPILATPGDAVGVEYKNRVSNPTSTPTKVLFPSGCLSMVLHLWNITGSDIKYLYVVWDALSDADAANKLADDTVRSVALIAPVTNGMPNPALVRTFSEAVAPQNMYYASDVASPAGTAWLVFDGKVKP